MTETELALDCLVTFESSTELVILAQECECLHSCVPCLIHNSMKVLTSTLEENVNGAYDIKEILTIEILMGILKLTTFCDLCPFSRLSCPYGGNDHGNDYDFSYLKKIHIFLF